jgi:hypothetical protein
MGDGLPDAGTQQEQGDDHGALAGPERVAVQIPAVDEAQVGEVEAEMKHRHPDQRDATQRVEAVVARAGVSGRFGHGLAFSRQHGHRGVPTLRP